MNQVKLGKFIRELRNELGMTQQELADKIEVSDKTISRWCIKYNLPSTKKEISKYTDEEWEKL